MSAAAIQAGSQTLGNINPTAGPGPFNLSATFGTLLMNGTINAQNLLVSPPTGFTPPSAARLREHRPRSTCPARPPSTAEPRTPWPSTGRTAGQYTKLTSTDLTDPNPIDLGGSTLAASLGGGYAPALGDVITIVSAANGITGQFGNAPNGSTIQVSGVSFHGQLHGYGRHTHGHEHSGHQHKFDQLAQSEPARPGCDFHRHGARGRRRP